jgi:DNA-binding TFAR19-related protein (PDSD5 family)
MIRLGTWASMVIVAFIASPGKPADEKELIAETGAMEIMLLRQKSVQEELKLTDVHGKKIHEFASEQWKKAKEIHKLPADQQDTKYEALSHENEKFLSSLLTPDQRKRLDQIGLQVAGLLSAGRPEVATALKLTAEQKNKLQELHKEARKEFMAIHNETKDERTKEAELKKLHEINHKRLTELLTPEQQQIWKALAGPEFKGELHYQESKPN